MQIRPNRPAPIHVPAGAKSVKVDYTGPVLKDEVIGHIPEDGLEFLSIPSNSGNDPVVRPQPVLDRRGKPTYAKQTETLDLRPHSALTHGLVGGSIGAVVGGLAGGAIGLLTGALPLVPWLAAGGASAGAALTGGLAAHRVAGDETRPDWELQSVVQHQLKGFSHHATAQTTTTTDSKGNTKTENTGWYYHTYTPNVEKKPIADEQFWAPVVRHSKGENDWLSNFFPSD